MYIQVLHAQFFLGFDIWLCLQELDGNRFILSISHQGPLGTQDPLPYYFSINRPFDPDVKGSRDTNICVIN